MIEKVVRKTYNLCCFADIYILYKNFLMDLIDKIIDKWSSIAFVLNEDTANDKFIKMAKGKLSKSLSDKLKSDDNLIGVADEIGINPNFKEKDVYKERQNALNGLDLSPQITEKAKNVIDILRKVTGKTGGQNWERLKNMVSNGQTYGLSYNEILRMKDFIDSLDLMYMYDRSISPSSKVVLKYGNKIASDGSLDDSDFDLNNMVGRDVTNWMGASSRRYKYTRDEAVFQMKRNMVDRYLASTYGIEMEIPNFSLGNKKVKDALLINFTSAFRCPAWNECLVKHACYARSGEGRHYGNEKLSNDKKHLLWEAGHNDPELMKLIVNMLRAYVVDYTSAIPEVKDMVSEKNKSQEFYELISKVGPKVNGDKFASLEFSELPQQVLEILKQHTRVKDIRLNENGDFIGQWLLDEFDKVAGDFRLIGVNTAAYSCRNLNFEGIKNIVINASRISMKGDSVARYFYAVPQKMYDAMSDTYEGKNISNEFNSISRIPIPLCSVGPDGSMTPNGNYYYKCPCGRTDFSVNGKALKNVNCYQCHLCYEIPDDRIKQLLSQSGGKYIVFVKAHGSMANKLDNKREMQIANTVGVPEGYVFGLEDSGEGYDTSDLDYSGTDSMHESVEPSIMLSQNEAINAITNNAITSMNEHLGGLGEMAISEQKKMFWKKINEMENVKPL